MFDSGFQLTNLFKLKSQHAVNLGKFRANSFECANNFYRNRLNFSGFFISIPLKYRCPLTSLKHSFFKKYCLWERSKFACNPLLTVGVQQLWYITQEL